MSKPIEVEIAELLRERKRDERIDQARLRSLYDYDARDGIFYHQGTSKRGTVARTVKGRPQSGYVVVYGEQIPSARAVWLWHHGEYPCAKLNRVDYDNTNDRIENLALRHLDGSVEGYGCKWVAWGPNRRFIKRCRTYEAACRAREAWDKGADLV